MLVWNRSRSQTWTKFSQISFSVQLITNKELPSLNGQDVDHIPDSYFEPMFSEWYVHAGFMLEPRVYGKTYTYHVYVEKNNSPFQS